MTCVRLLEFPCSCSPVLFIPSFHGDSPGPWAAASGRGSRRHSAAVARGTRGRRQRSAGRRRALSSRESSAQGTRIKERARRCGARTTELFGGTLGILKGLAGQLKGAIKSETIWAAKDARDALNPAPRELPLQAARLNVPLVNVWFSFPVWTRTAGVITV